MTVGEIEEKLENLVSKGIPWGALLLSTTHGFRQFIGVNSSLQPVLIVHFEKELKGYTQLESITINSKVNAQNDVWQTTFELALPEFRKEFLELCEHLASSTQFASSGEECPKLHVSAYETWVGFYKRAKNLSKEVVRGLFGELYFLSEFLCPNVGSSLALDSWKGPLGNAQDFLLPNNRAFEIKTFQPSNPKLLVSSEGQLDFPGDLRLVAIRLLGHSSPEKGKTLKELVDEISSQLPDKDLSKFRFLVSQVGFRSDHLLANSMYFEVQEVSAFDANKIDFPKIVTSDLDPRISNVSYALNTSQLADFKVELDF